MACFIIPHLAIVGVVSTALALKCYECEYAGLTKGGAGTCWDKYTAPESHMVVCDPNAGEVSCFKMKFEADTGLVNVFYGEYSLDKTQLG